MCEQDIKLKRNGDTDQTQKNGQRHKVKTKSAQQTERELSEKSTLVALYYQHMYAQQLSKQTRIERSTRSCSHSRYVPGENYSNRSLEINLQPWFSLMLKRN